jgi:phage/plasmid-associated DNA primase
VRTLTPFDDFQSQFWLRPNLEPRPGRDGGIVFRADEAAWHRRIDRPAEEGLPPPDAVIPLRNGLFDLAAWRRDQTIGLMPHTPLFFNTGVVEAELPIKEAQAAMQAGGVSGLEAFARSLCPEWLGFLDNVFRHDDPKAAPVTIRELHKVIGNFLTTDMTYHQANMVWLIGPPGAGKSVLQGVIEALLGPSNCVPSTISQLDGQFHLRSWIGKRLAIFPDLDVSGRVDKKKIVELLKMLATGDPMTVDRKHLDEIVGYRNMARMLIAANQMPSLPDPSVSFDRRSMCFEFRHPVKKSEMDPHLLETLTSPRSLAGVLLLALIGLIDLVEEGFTQPVWSAGPLEDLKDQGSLYPAFIAECLEIVRPDEPGYAEAWVSNREITLAYGRFGEAEGSTYTPRAATVISELKAPLIQAGWASVGRKERGKVKGVQGVRLTPRGVELATEGEPQGAGSGGSAGYGAMGFV